jgi:DNA-binding transcriptional ArsR family regulator
MSHNSQLLARLTRAAPLFGALGDETRLELVAHLCSRGPRSISELTAETRVTRQAVSKHLGVLSKAGVVRDFRRGRERIWELETARLGEAQRHLEQISTQWDQAIERLRRFVEED